MATNLTALSSAIQLIADAANDTVQALQPGQSILQTLLDYENLIGDLEVLIPQIGDIPSEISQIGAAEYVTLIDTLVADLEISNEKAKAVVDAAVKLLNDLVLTILPNVECLVAAIKS